MWDLSSPTRVLWAFLGSFWACWGWVCALLCLVAEACLTLCDPMGCSTPLPCPSLFLSLLKLMSIESMISSKHFILLPSFPPAFNLSQLFPMCWLFTSGGQSIGASPSASVLPVNIELISFKIGWFDLVSAQQNLKSLLQHHNLKASILQWWLALNFVVWLIGISIKVYI